MHEIAARGVRGWQIQLTVAMGNAVDNDHLLLQPYELLKLMPRLGDLYDEAYKLGVVLQAGNNIGYFGPYEHKWRPGNQEKHFSGCAAGHAILGIQADGAIKGCPSLPTSQFTGGGCTWTSTVLFGRPGNNPYCHYRAHSLAKQGLRERIVKTEEAPGTPFDQGRFALITEPLDGGEGLREILHISV